jgi:hypothetical protein
MTDHNVFQPSDLLLGSMCSIIWVDLVLLVGYEVLTAVVMKSFILWDVNLCTFRRIISALLAACFILASCLAYFCTLDMEATRSSKTSTYFERTTLRLSHKIETFLVVSVGFHSFEWKSEMPVWNPLKVVQGGPSWREGRVTGSLFLQ